MKKAVVKNMIKVCVFLFCFCYVSYEYWEVPLCFLCSFNTNVMISRQVLIRCCYSSVTFMLRVYYTSIIFPLKQNCYITFILTLYYYITIMLILCCHRRKLCKQILLISVMLECNKCKRLDSPPPPHRFTSRDMDPGSSIIWQYLRSDGLQLWREFNGKIKVLTQGQGSIKGHEVI